MQQAEVAYRSSTTTGTSSALAAVALGQVVAVVGRGVPWEREPPIATNMAASRDYARVAPELRALVGEDARVGSSSEIGALAYHCRYNVVDAFSDRDYVREIVRERLAAAGPVTGALLRANFANLALDGEPAPLAHQLRWAAGPAPDPLPAPAVAAWNLDSGWTGPGHLLLLPADPPPN